MEGLYKKAGSTFFLKVFGLGIAFIFQIILGRLLEPASYGEYTMYLTYSSIFTIITVFGMDQNLIKEIAKNNNDKKRSNSLLQLSMIISIMLCFLVSVTVFFFKDKLDFGADGVYLFIAMSIIRTIVMIFDGFLQGNGLVVRVTLLNDVINNLLKVIFFIAIANSGTSSLKAALWSFIFSEFIMAIFRLLDINKILGNKYKLTIRLDKKVKKEFIKYSSTVLFVSGIGILLQNVDRIMISSYLDLANVGIYKVSQNYVSLIGVFISPFIAFWPVISKLYHDNKLFEIQEEMKRIVKIVTYSVIPMFFIFVFQSNSLLSIFGEYYATKAGGQVLIILAFSFLIDAISGPIGSILTMTKYAKFILYNSIAALIVNIVLNFLLIDKFGIVGVAIATGISIILNNLLSIFEVKILLGIFSYDFKNIIQIILLSVVNLVVGGGLSKTININSYFLQVIIYGISIYTINMIIIGYIYRKEISVFLRERGKK